MKKKSFEKTNNSFIYFLSFIIPSLIMAACFFAVKVYPWGPNSVLTFDLRGELLPLYGYLSGNGAGYDNMFYSMSGGLGGEFFGSAVLYISPFDLIYSFIPAKLLPSAIWLMIIVKVGLCGFGMSFFLRRNGKISISIIPTIVLSCCYALMSYNITYFISPMWYDAVFFLPVMAVYSEKIIYGKKSLGFIFFTAISIICDYYIAYMAIIGLTLYFVFRLIEEGYDFKKTCLSFFLYAVHGFFSAGLSCFILVPVIFDFLRGKIASGEAVNSSLFFKFSVFDLLKNFLPQSYSNLGINQVPNIYCSVFVLVSVAAFFISKKTNARTKLTAFLIILFYFCSFIISPLDRVWHGFRDPLSFSCRYSFTFCFFMICIALRGIAYFTLKINNRRLMQRICIITFVYTCIELFLNGSYLISKIQVDYQLVLNDEYARMLEPAEYLISDELNSSRLEKNYRFTNWDGALYGYDGIELFSSSYNDSIIKFLYALGIDSYNNHISSSGLNPATASLFNVGYYLAYFQDYSDYYDLVDSYKLYYLYKNPNALPLGVPLSQDYLDKNRHFSDDPFDNVNVVYSDIFGEPTEIFRTVEYEVEEYDEEIEEITLRFKPDKEGHYWFYRGVPEESEYLTVDNVNFHKVLSYSLDGFPLGSYGQFGYRYCSDLGYLTNDHEYILSIDSPYTQAGDVYLVYFDQDKLRQLSGAVKGATLEKIDKSGIILVNDNEKECDLLISLPYEAGYRIRINGEESGYKDYRNSLLSVHLNPGRNKIVITYIPKGLPTGIVLSAFSLFGLIGFIYRKHGRKD